jgi:hypothetical protein
MLLSAQMPFSAVEHRILSGQLCVSCLSLAPRLKGKARGEHPDMLVMALLALHASVFFVIQSSSRSVAGPGLYRPAIAPVCSIRPSLRMYDALALTHR